MPIDEGLAKGKRTIVAEVASQLRHLSLTSVAGASLGNEAELLIRLNVSRPTFRQAIRLLEREQLVETRRGSKGGLYATRPNQDSAVQIPALFLRLEAATTKNSVEASSFISAEAARIVGVQATSEQREFLKSWGSRNLPRFISIAGEDVIRIDSEFVMIKARLCHNPMLELFIDISYQFGLMDIVSPVRAFFEDHGKKWVDLMASELEAIIDSRPDDAAEAVYSRARMLLAYLS